MRHSSWLHAVVPTAHMLQMRELEVQRGDTACPRSHIYTSVHACQPSSWSRLTPSSMAAESPLQHITFKFLTHNEIKVSPLVTLAIFQKYNSHMSIAVPGQGVTESSSDWSSRVTHRSLPGEHRPAQRPKRGAGPTRKEKGAGEPRRRAEVMGQRA